MIRFNLKYIFLFVAFLVVALSCLHIGHRSNQNKISSYESSIRAEQQNVKKWQDNTGLWRSRAESAEIKSNDALKYLATYDKNFATLSQEFDGLKKNLKNLQYVGFTGTSSSYNIHTSSKDTIFVFQKDTSKAKYFDYKDSSGWFTAKGYMLENGDVPLLDFETRDSLVTVLTKKKRLFRKAIYTQEIKSYNPHTKVSYNRSVLVHKPKRFLGIF